MYKIIILTPVEENKFTKGIKIEEKVFDLSRRKLTAYQHVTPEADRKIPSETEILWKGIHASSMEDVWLNVFII